MCGPGCFDNWTPGGLLRPHQPIRGGWKIDTLPPSIKEEPLRWAWENRTTRKRASSAKEAVGHVAEFLRKNGRSVSKTVRDEIRAHAENLWRETDPQRFLGRKTVAARPEKEKMSWARGFWEAANMALIAECDYPDHLVSGIAMLGLQLLRSPLGCEMCESHWQRVIEAYPPMSLVNSMARARVWLWAAHNESREQHAPHPYSAIAKAHGWPSISDDEVADILKDMGMSDLVANQQTR